MNYKYNCLDMSDTAPRLSDILSVALEKFIMIPNDLSLATDCLLTKYILGMILCSFKYKIQYEEMSAMFKHFSKSFDSCCQEP